MRIREAVPEDRDFLLALAPQLVSFGPPPWRDSAQMTATDERVLAEALADSIARAAGVTILLAEDGDGTRLGLLHLRPEIDYYTRKECGHVADLVVAPEARGRGVGKALMAAGEVWARDRGYEMLSLNVFVENEGARALYEERGFAAEWVRYVKPLR